MDAKSQMEIAYDTYLASDDKVIMKDGFCFYKIVHKHRLSYQGGTVLITVPHGLFDHGAGGRVFDECNRFYTLGSPLSIAFWKPIPRWYFETVTVPVMEIHEIDKIGIYLTAAVDNVP